MNFLGLRSMFRSFAVVALLLTFLTGYAFAGEQKQIILLHTNDIHGVVFPVFDKKIGDKGAEVGGLTHLATKIEQLRKEYPGKVLLLDAGDMSQGTPVSNIFYGAPVTDYMNYVKYDASTFGNHEFDWDETKMKEQVARRKFPMVCANITEKSTGKVPSFMKPYIIVERNGMKIGVIGLATVDTPKMSFPKNVESFNFTDPLAAVEKYQKELEKKGVKVIGIISHMGYDVDQKFAEKLSGIAFIVGGHSHTFVTEPKEINGIPVLQAGCWGKNIGFADLTFDKDTGKLVKFSGKLIPIMSKEIPKDEKLDKMINVYQDKVKDLMSKVIGELSADATNTAPKGAGNTSIGDLMTDILRHITGTDLAFYNTHGLRANLTKGKMTREALFFVLPFDNNIITYEIPGSELHKVIEYYVDRPSFSQMSGVTLDYDSDKPEGQRVSDIKVDGKEIDKNKTYKISSIDFLYSVSQDCQPIKEAKNVVYGKNIRDEVEKYIIGKEKINVPEEVRIKVLKNPPSESRKRH